jgi:hypothetical protein
MYLKQAMDWNNFKIVYNTIVNNAFEDKEEKEKAKFILFKLLTSTIDLILSGENKEFQQAFASLEGRVQHMFQSPFSFPGMDGMGMGMDGMGMGMGEGMERGNDVTNNTSNNGFANDPSNAPIFTPPSFRETSYRSNENPGEGELNGPTLNADELRQLFSFLPMFDGERSAHQ